MDSTHFRQRAARAREMAQFGDDLRLSRMLLDVAVELDAEAAAMEAHTQAHSESGFAPVVTRREATRRSPARNSPV